MLRDTPELYPHLLFRLNEIENPHQQRLLRHVIKTGKIDLLSSVFSNIKHAQSSDHTTFAIAILSVNKNLSSMSSLRTEKSIFQLATELGIQDALHKASLDFFD